MKALLLDLDGTLINSEKAFFNCFKKVLQERYNITITENDYKKYELEQNAKLLEVLRYSYDQIKTIEDKEIMNFIYETYLYEFKTVIQDPEVVDNFNVLKQLKNTGLKLGLITTCRRCYLNILLEELELKNLFDIIIAREDVKNLKPAPDAYLMALKKLKLSPDDCLAFEDSKRGIDAAILSKLKVIIVNSFNMIKNDNEEIVSANKELKKILNLRKNM